MFEYIGAIHIHSKFSDGTGEIPEIAKYANEIGLDYIIITDHNTLRGLHEGYEKWYNNTLCLVGCEINDKNNKNHYLAFGINETFSTRTPAKEYVKKIKQIGGVGIIAHPHEKRTHMPEHPAYPWTEWNIDDFDGIEIWNHMSEWMENLTEENKYRSFIHPLKTITAPMQITLKLWDELNLKRKVIGIGGVDAHAHKYNLLGFLEVEIFPYKVLFKSVRTHILLDKELEVDNNPENLFQSKWLLYKSIKAGKCFIANDYVANSKGFRFFAEQEGKIYQMGDFIESYKDVFLKVLLPQTFAKIKLIRNGILIDEIDGNEYSKKIDAPGAYRVEIYKDDRAWIYSNHIRIGI
jgi:hypothetical protein